MHAEQLLSQLIGPVCAAESIASAQKAGMSLADWVSEAVSRTNPMDHVVLFMVGDRHCQVPMPAWLWLEFQRGVCWEATLAGGIVPKTTFSDEERQALEVIADKEVDGEDFKTFARMEEALQKTVFLLDVLEKFYGASEQVNQLQDQRVSGLFHLSAGLDAELLNCFKLVCERSKALELQRTALRRLADLKLNERDVYRLNRDDEFREVRFFARRTAAKQGQVAA